MYLTLVNMTDSNLYNLRQQIDDLDSKLIELLSKRANVVVEVGKFKRDTETPIYAHIVNVPFLTKCLRQTMDRCLIKQSKRFTVN